MVLAIAWAVYLVPKALKHHDEVVHDRSVDRFSTAMRVLARREPVDRRNARLVVTPPGRTEPPSVGPRPRPSVAARRAAARAAARRRRRVLAVLLGLDLVTVLLAAFTVVAWWSVAVPVALTVAFLVLARAQVRRENDALWTPAAVAQRVDGETTDPASPSPDMVVPHRAIRVDQPDGTVQASRPVPQGDQEFPADEDTVQLAMSELQTFAVSMETDDGGSLWDPLPVTLPTYVNKARAARSVRTIDLGAPDAWTSGRDEADTALVEQAAAAETAQPEDGQGEHRRAVGS